MYDSKKGYSMRRPCSPSDEPFISPARVGFRQGRDGISVVVDPHLISARFVDPREGRLEIKHDVGLA